MESYKLTITKNPRIAAEVEALIRWSSYLVATKSSPILGELLSSGANLLVLCNDIILRGTHPKLKLDLSNCATQLKTILHAIQSVELLAEFFGREYYGTVGKWAIITAIQIAKATIRLVLLLVFNEGISKSQPVALLDRIHLCEILKLEEKCSPDSPKQGSIKLRSSGRTLRSITEAPARAKRFVEQDLVKNSPFDRLQKHRLKILLERYIEQTSTQLTERQLYGELLHIARPVAHLALMGGLGPKSWISYIASMAMDVGSLYMIRPSTQLSTEIVSQGSNEGENGVEPNFGRFNMSERLELGQRASSLLLYLLRSPFFDEYTKRKAIYGLATSAESIPLVGSFVASFFNYIPEWQQAYFRVWSE